MIFQSQCKFLDENGFLGSGQVSSMSRQDEREFIFHGGYWAYFKAQGTLKQQECMHKLECKDGERNTTCARHAMVVRSRCAAKTCATTYCKVSTCHTTPLYEVSMRQGLPMPYTAPSTTTMQLSVNGLL